MKQICKNHASPTKSATPSSQYDISEHDREMIKKLVDRAFAEYGETIKRLGDA